MQETSPSPLLQTNRIHASAVWMPDGIYQGVMILGESGSGKSSLCFGLIQRGGLLIADDQVMLDHHGQAYAPPPLLGLLEVAGVGVLNVPHVQQPATIHAVIHLDATPLQERIPVVQTHPVYQLPMCPLQAHHPLLVDQAFAWTHYTQK